MTLDRVQLREFAERGFIVVSNVIPADLRAAAMRAIDDMISRQPPPTEKRGFHFYWLNDVEQPDTMLSLLTDSGVIGLVESVIAPLRLLLPRQVQISLNIQPWNHRPGGPHLDGMTPPEPSGRPGTFTLLAGVILTDQTEPDMGNLWVWPRSHKVCAAYLREHGPDTLHQIAHPTYPMAPPEQVLGRAGDLLLAHYMLGHNMGGNLSSSVRRVVYFRLKSEAHEAHWRDYVRDELLEFAAVRSATAS
ncbi:MAG: phytanoyl-CoA dioxygenase family protein [Xanthobacteraceae bacterium]